MCSCLPGVIIAATVVPCKPATFHAGAAVAVSAAKYRNHCSCTVLYCPSLYVPLPHQLQWVHRSDALPVDAPTGCCEGEGQACIARSLDICAASAQSAGNEHIVSTPCRCRAQCSRAGCISMFSLQMLQPGVSHSATAAAQGKLSLRACVHVAALCWLAGPGPTVSRCCLARA